ncbi:MAG: glycosyltransferase family 2 protein [Candidatus Shapirobacteria bacterium]
MIAKKSKISVVIPVWNGEKLLKKNLPLVFKALPKGTEVILVDDGSKDGSGQYLKNLKTKDYPLKIFINKTNQGFVYSANLGVKKAKSELVLLLNTDVVPQKNFLSPALRHFQDEKVFAVSLAEQGYGWAKIWWRGGFIHIGDGGKSKSFHICAWASGGTGVFRKKMWEELGGFDSLYSPYYWEDFDLGFRAWKQGWKIIWEPKALVFHQHESSTSKVNRQYVNLIKERNQLLFIWKNISNRGWRFANYLGMALRVVLGPNYLKVIMAAKRQYKICGRPMTCEGKLTDRQVLKLFR